MYVKLLGDTIIDLWNQENETITPTDRWGKTHTMDALDVLATLRSDGIAAVSAINKDADNARSLSLTADGAKKYRVHTLNGESTESYNDIGVDGITLKTGEWTDCTDTLDLSLEPHSVNVIEISF